MFYATKIQSIQNGFAIDTAGKSLQFIGCLPVKVGDTVFTDGNVIFGHAQPKGAAEIFDEPSGIPVLGDEYSLADQNEELRGYFKPNGKYKRFKVAGGNWIVNNKKIYKHDTDTAEIIDAEITDDGDIYTVEKKITQNADNDKEIFYVYFIKASQIDATPEYNYYSMIDFYTVEMMNKYYPLWYDRKGDGNFWIPFQDSDFAESDETTIKKCEFVIKKNGVEIQRINFDAVIEFVKDETEPYIDVEVSNDYLSEHTMPGEWNKGFLDYIEHSKLRAQICNFKILSDGTWEALIEVEFWKERDFPQYTDPGKSSKIHIAGTVAAHMRFLMKFDSAGNIEQIAKYGDIYPLFCVGSATTLLDELQPAPSGYFYSSVRNTELMNQSVDRTTFPYKLLIGDTMGILNSESDFYCYAWTFIWDSRNIMDYDNPIEEFVDEFIYPVQDDYHATIKNHGGKFTQWQLGGIAKNYSGANKQLFGEVFPDKNDAHKWNMSLATLKGGNYLFGIRKDNDRDIAGALYKIGSDGTTEQVGNGLKNFRLRELKRISKARK